MESKKETAETMKTKIAQYMRYILQCPVVAFECGLYGHNGVSDVLAITEKRYLIDIEVKLTLSDLRSDINKPKHLLFYNSHFDCECGEWRKAWQREWKMIKIYSEMNIRGIPINHIKKFYFAVSPDLVNKAKLALDKLYPYAGLMVVKPEHNYYGHYISIERKAKEFNTERVGIRRIIALVKSMSATLVRTSAKAEGVKLL